MSLSVLKISKIQNNLNKIIIGWLKLGKNVWWITLYIIYIDIYELVLGGRFVRKRVWWLLLALSEMIDAIIWGCLRVGNDDYCFEVRDDGQYYTDRMKEGMCVRERVR